MQDEHVFPQEFRSAFEEREEDLRWQNDVLHSGTKWKEQQELQPEKKRELHDYIKQQGCHLEKIVKDIFFHHIYCGTVDTSVCQEVNDTNDELFYQLLPIPEKYREKYQRAGEGNGRLVKGPMFAVMHDLSKSYFQLG